MIRTIAKPIAAALVIGLGVTACASSDPYTGERKTSNTLKGGGLGALGGAAIGAVIGAASGNAGKGALIGAGVGVLAGGAVGVYMDRQEEKLRQRLAQTGVGIRRVGDNIELIMPGDITFATGVASIDAGFYPVLDDVALVLNEFESSYVEVSGHTDTVGGDAPNQTLSQQRAQSVGAYLANRQVIRERLIVAGFGETRPLVPTADGVDEPLNRRVEIRISPLT